MERLTINLGSRKSNILIGERLENLSKYLPDTRVIIITDENVYHLYRHLFPGYEAIVIGTGEKNKTLETTQYIYEQLVEKGLDRSGYVVGIGGGIVCDIAGFAASTYMRGVRFGFVSTTLLSQVDASIGGKNGVNLHGYKNMIGVFNQPDFVICDFNLLKSLPPDEFRTGFAEIIKHACIQNRSMFEFIEDNHEKALENDYDTIYKLVYDSLIIKGGIVEKDERESGERRKLNFGHTYGHAIEKIAGISHGEAISQGMAIASGLSLKKGYLSEKENNRILELLKKFKLPTEVTADKKEIFEVLGKDKKREKDDMNFVLLHDIGKAIIEKININELEHLI